MKTMFNQTLVIASVWGFLALALQSSDAAAQTELASGAAASPTVEATKPAETVNRVLLNYPGRLGLGLSVGNVVTGVTAKVWATESVAFQASVGEGAAGNDFRCHLDLLFDFGTWTSSDGQYTLPAYVGLGGVLGRNFAAGAYPSDTEGGFRLPVGMAVLVRGNPVELFFEIAPEFAIRNDDSIRGRYVLYTSGSVGARYYF